jgi:hypothetical protein
VMPLWRKQVVKNAKRKRFLLYLTENASKI